MMKTHITYKTVAAVVDCTSVVITTVTNIDILLVVVAVRRGSIVVVDKGGSDGEVMLIAWLMCIMW
jgi:hypothetical protein